MGNISYTAHVSNKKSAITSKSKLAAVAKHNLRKYKSSDYSKDNICIIYGTSKLIDDVKTVYHKEFDEALEEYNKKQTRQDRKIEDYFEHVAGKEQDMAVEIIIQIGDREFWKQFDDMKSYMKLSYQIILDELRKRLPQFVVANAVVHLDEDSPHMHIVGVPVADGYKKGLCKQVSKRKVFTKDVLSGVLQDELREVANKEVEDWFGEQIKEKSKGRNHDLSVAEYKVAQETKHLTQLQKQVEESDMAVKANKAVEKEYTDKKEKLETDISYLESMWRITKSLSEMDSRESKQISMELDEKRSELQSVNEELANAIEKAEDAAKLLDRIKNFVSSFRLFAPTIEEYANQVEADKIIEAGNSFRGILDELGKLLETFKELIKEGLCWFPRLMRWKTSKGEVAPVFLEKSDGYSYSLYGYMNVDTKEYYTKESVQWEITAGNRIGTVEQMDANVEAMVRDLQEILRIGRNRRDCGRCMEKGRERLTFGKIKIECKPFDKTQNLCSATLHDIIKTVRENEK